MPSDAERPPVLRIVIVVENVAPAQDHRLRKQATSLAAAGHHVTVVCRRHPRNRDLRGVVLREYPAPPDARSQRGYLVEYGWSWLMAMWHVARAAAGPGIDVMQVCGAPDIYFPLSWVLRRAGKGVVYDQRDPSPELYDARYGARGSLVRKVLVRFEQLTYDAADHVITVNETLRQVAQVRGGVPADRVTVVGNGPVMARTQRRPEPGLKGGASLLCCWHGLMGPQDHLDAALRAIHRVVHDKGRQDCAFVFIGDGESRSAAERLVAELQLQDVVRFTGWLPEAEVFTHLSTADVGIEPNLEDVVSPVKVMEYMAFGLPVVAFDVTETRVLAGDAALYAAPGDESCFADLLDALLASAELRAQLGQRGRRRVESTFSWDRQAVAYLEVFRALVSRGSTTPRGPLLRRPLSSRAHVPHARSDVQGR